MSEKLNCGDCINMRATIPIDDGELNYKKATARCSSEYGVIRRTLKDKLFKIGVKEDLGYVEWKIYANICRNYEEDTNDAIKRVIKHV